MIKKIIIAFIVIPLICLAQSTGGGELSPQLKTNEKALQKWQNLKFGMFIHWGPVTLRGTEIGWSRGTEVPIKEYDNLYKEFDPVLFNAREWVSTLKNAGMKYLVIVTKHHDGFCLWPSAYTDYDIASTPYRKDILKQLEEECQKQGILFGTYYSIVDWYNPYYTTRHGGDPRPIDSAGMPVYFKYLKNQVKELIENYDTNILWFDGWWEDSWTHEYGMELYKYARSLKNDILINNRVDKGRGENGMTESDKFAGDFGTPEQKIGAFYPNQPWESCITICTHWSWAPNDKMKNLRECIQTLAQTAGGGGNLLLNVAPMPDGRMEQRQIKRLKEIGGWLKIIGESIYGTKGGPIKPTNWMACTHKENKMFVHLFKWPEKLILPEFQNYKIQSVKILNNKQPLTYKIIDGKTEINLPAEQVDLNNTVIEIQFDEDIDSIQPVEIPQNQLAGLDGAEIKIKYPFSPKYSADGLKSLTDEVRGSLSYTDSKWLGFEKSDFEATIDLGDKKEIHKFGIGCLQDQNTWIFLPKSVKVYVSDDNQNFSLAASENINASARNDTVLSSDIMIPLKGVKARYLKLIAENIGVCPAWHKGAGGDAWLFVDEILMK